MSQLTRDYKGSGRRNLRSDGMKEFALGVLAGALLAGGIAALIAAHGRHRQVRSCAPAAGGTQSPAAAAAGTRPAATAPGAAPAAPTPSGAAGASGTTPATGQPSAAPAQHYDFYQMLPRLTVPVPAKPSSSPLHRPASPTALPSYLLQVGSYSSAAQAHQVLERLGRMGLAAQIQRVTEHGRSLERVRVGPVDSAELTRTRRELAGAGFHPLVIPTRGQ